MGPCDASFTLNMYLMVLSCNQLMLRLPLRQHSFMLRPLQRMYLRQCQSNRSLSCLWNLSDHRTQHPSTGRGICGGVNRHVADYKQVTIGTGTVIGRGHGLPIGGMLAPVTSPKVFATTQKPTAREATVPLQQETLQTLLPLMLVPSLLHGMSRGISHH